MSVITPCFSFPRYSMAKKFADLTAQVKTEKRFSRRLDYPTAAATRSTTLDATSSAAASAERLSPVVATSQRSSPQQQQSSASSSPSSVSRVTVIAPPQVVVEAAALQGQQQQQQQQMRAQFHVHHEHLVRRSDDRTRAFSRVSHTVIIVVVNVSRSPPRKFSVFLCVATKPFH